MNRSIALFVALVLLLAHILAIHNDGEGNFAFPYDQAYAGYRLARNLVFEGQLQWNPGMSAYESYPSALWVGVASLGERIEGVVRSMPAYLFCQTAGVVAALFTVILLSRFRRRRTAGLIAPLLFVSCGCTAAAAANGLETAFFTMFAVTSFWSFERGYSWRFALATSLLCLTRPEGAVLVAGLLFLRLVARLSDVEPEHRTLAPFIAPLLMIGGGLLLRFKTTGFLLPPACVALWHPGAGQWIGGLEYVRDAVLVCVSLLLLVYPLLMLVRGGLTGIGIRALVLALLWTAYVVLQGRAPLPFAEALVPALPFFFLAIQEGMIEVLDGTSQSLRKFALASLVACLGGSALASKEPGDLGPIPTELWHARWMNTGGSARFGYEQPLGRLGLEEEIRLTNRLRAAGLFARDGINPVHTLLTPWPGAMGYLSRLQVFDLLGRTNEMPGIEQPAPWSRRSRADVVAALEQDPSYDYVVPLLRPLSHVPTLREIATKWRDELDLYAAAPDRLAAIEHALAPYELITVPIYGYSRGASQMRGEPFLLLRRRALGLHPKVEIHVDGHAFAIDVKHCSHQQLVDLRVQVVDAKGRKWYLRPTGDLVRGDPVHARAAILLYNTGTRTIELMHGVLPEMVDGAKLVELRAVLKNPNGEGDDPLASTSDEVVLALGV